MTVRIQKDALNLREELVDLRKPSGIAGEALLRADSVQEQRDLIGAGRKNLIINGGFDVWQRGTSQSSNGYGCADRWAMYRVTNGAQRSTDVPSSDFKYSMQYTSLTTGMADLWLRQSIEDYGRVIRDTSKTFTVSFWAKADRIGVVMVDLNDRNHGNITVGTAWQKYSHTFTGDASNAGDHAALDFGSNENAWTINITGIQFELGSVATEFEHRPFGEERDLCLRYFWKVTPAYSFQGTLWTSNNYHSCIQFPVPMRTFPTYTDSGAANFTLFGAGAAYSSNAQATLDQTSLYNTEIKVWSASASSSSAFIRLNNSPAFMAFDAEL